MNLFNKNSKNGNLRLKTKSIFCKIKIIYKIKSLRKVLTLLILYFKNNKIYLYISIMVVKLQ